MKTRSLIGAFTAFFLVLSVPICPAAAITLSTDTAISFNNTNYDGQDLSVTNCTVTIDGMHAFNSLQILNGGKVTHSGTANGLLENRLSVTNELHLLTGTDAVSLSFSNVVVSTLLVRDAAGLVFYTNVADYLVGLDTNGFTTIQRTVASTIPDGATVRADYDFLDAPISTGLSVAVAGDVSIESGGAIDVSGRGYAAVSGPGGGGTVGVPSTGAGGGHGGYGGSASNAPVRLVWGDLPDVLFQ